MGTSLTGCSLQGGDEALDSFRDTVSIFTGAGEPHTSDISAVWSDVNVVVPEGVARVTVSPYQYTDPTVSPTPVREVEIHLPPGKKTIAVVNCDTEDKSPRLFSWEDANRPVNSELTRAEGELSLLQNGYDWYLRVNDWESLQTINTKLNHAINGSKGIGSQLDDTTYLLLLAEQIPQSYQFNTANTDVSAIVQALQKEFKVEVYSCKDGTIFEIAEQVSSSDLVVAVSFAYSSWVFPGANTYMGQEQKDIITRSKGFCSAQAVGSALCYMQAAKDVPTIGVPCDVDTEVLVDAIKRGLK